MKKWRGLSLNLKLLACFFATIFVFSLIHLWSYTSLLVTMKKDAQTSAKEQIHSAVARLDESFSQIRNEYFALTYTPAYRQASRYAVPSKYEMVNLTHQANLNLSNVGAVYAYATFFSGTNEVVTANGNYLDADYFTRHYVSEVYTEDFWREEKRDVFSQRYYSAAVFTTGNPVFDQNSVELIPVTFKSYWNSNIMLLVFLDIRGLCKSADVRLVEDFYIFSSEGELLFSSEDEPAMTSAPQQDDPIFELEDGSYVAQQSSETHGLVYVKIMPKNNVVGKITKNLYFSMFTALAALVVGIAIAVIAVWRLMHPVRDILQMLSIGEGRNPEAQDDLLFIRTSVEQILRQREKYVQQLSKKDAALSGFLLQSQLKNIYVELDVPDHIIPAEDRMFYILYVRIHYRRGALDNIAVELPAVAHMVFENLQQTLTLLFDTVLIFQLEPNQFVAKISPSADVTDITEPIEYLLQRLDHESEFAFFTVVQSEALCANGDFTLVYDQVLEAAQYALAENHTQLIRLPMQIGDSGSFSFPAEQEQRLHTLVREGQSELAQALTQNILRNNLDKGVRRIHVLLLGSAITGATVRALSGLNIPGDTFGVKSGGVLSQLAQCDNSEDYVDLLSEFVGSAAMCTQQAPVVDHVLEGVRVFLENNYRREFSMDEMADELHLSKSYLSTYFKGKIGVNLSDRIQYFRIQKAIKLLANRKLRVGDIGGMVGIGNINTFLRQFKKYTGMTPKEYRKQGGSR